MSLTLTNNSGIVELSQSIMGGSPSRPEDYCNPKKLLKLPFPFPEECPVDRFKFKKKDRFLYYGRQSFWRLYQIATMMSFHS